MVSRGGWSLVWCTWASLSPSAPPNTNPSVSWGRTEWEIPLWSIQTPFVSGATSAGLDSPHKPCGRGTRCCGQWRHQCRGGQAKERPGTLHAHCQEHAQALGPRAAHCECGIFCVWIQKAGAGSSGYSETGNSHVFITSIGALGSIFVNCWADLQIQCMPSALTGLISHPLVTNIYNMN